MKIDGSILAVSIGAAYAVTSVYSAQAEEAASGAYISPSEEAVSAMVDLPQGEPIHALSLVRFNARAEYPSGITFAAEDWTGAEAFEAYRSGIKPIVRRLGGGSIYSGDALLTLVGPEHENWDAVFIIYYPNASAMAEMSQDPDYQKNALHRAASLADSRLILVAE